MMQGIVLNGALYVIDDVIIVVYVMEFMRWVGGCIAKSVNHIMHVKKLHISIILYGYIDKKFFRLYRSEKTPIK